MTKEAIRANKAAIGLLMNTLNGIGEGFALPAIVVTRRDPQHRVLAWTVFCLVSMGLLLMFISLIVGTARAQRVAEKWQVAQYVSEREYREHLRDTTAGYQRMATMEEQVRSLRQQLRDQEKRINDRLDDNRRISEANQERVTAMMPVLETIKWFGMIGSGILVSVGGAMGVYIWKGKR